MESAWKNKLKKERDRQNYQSLSPTVRRYLLSNNALTTLDLSPDARKRVLNWRDKARDELVENPELREELAGHIQRRKDIQQENRQYTGWGTVIKEVKK